MPRAVWAIGAMIAKVTCTALLREKAIVDRPFVCDRKNYIFNQNSIYNGLMDLFKLPTTHKFYLTLAT